MTDEQRQYEHWVETHQLHKYARWLLGGVALLLVTAAGTGWKANEWASEIEAAVGEQSGRIDTLEDRYTRQRERMAAIEAMQSRDGQSIARIEERITSQGESLGRIEANVNELARFLRQQNGGGTP